jgi:hypothetical protein
MEHLAPPKCQSWDYLKIGSAIFEMWLGALVRRRPALFTSGDLAPVPVRIPDSEEGIGSPLSLNTTPAYPGCHSLALFASILIFHHSSLLAVGSMTSPYAAALKLSGASEPAMMNAR